MEFSGSISPDHPAPPSVDEVSRVFTVPLMTLAAQSALTELGVGTMSGSSNGEAAVLEVVSISFTLWRNPADPEDPANLAELSEEQQRAVDLVPTTPLPAWMVERLRLMRYPMLWEAVQTTRESGEGRETVEAVLVGHVNHIVTNSFRDERVRGDFPGELDSPVTEKHIERVPVVVDGMEVPGVRIDTDPDVFGLGVALEGRIATAVVAREFLPRVTLAFETRLEHA
ncbi:hypothetical protein GCM10025867_44240 [Frondihabitans sucicola]|uniref:Uncharacterized protein n=1 Tax=Frondihabitans sucicola TaxID=1268041 RepID=A0ABM8GUP2_9MICO|nr:hypothetical protein [Frondihabitans sucicola]BDZ52183.1 hypothetical protein GCM10025867_44240 [Frondihabitans sucicola]